MKIIIAGNIGSGKSSLIKALHPLIGGQPTMLDQIREESSDGTFKGEMKALAIAYLQLKNPDYKLVETVGMGRFYDYLQRYLTEKRIDTYKVLLRCQPDTCLARIKARNKYVPLPYKLDPNISVWKLHDNFRQTASQYDIILDAEKYTPSQLAVFVAHKFQSI